ncbi:MAG: hypothetical protein HW415_1044 [Deltaproteobacteria bacterium]|nr:hypothetical protein [Deltaproteobacteria bacterium]
MYNIIPNGPLQLNTDYSVTFSGAKDLAGNAMTAATFNFKTTAVADTTPPVTTASPPAGAYTSAQTVTLTANETATIYYTTDGITAPTTSSTVYTSPIVINSTTILKFFAKDVAGNSETLQSLTYTISTLDTTPPTTVASPTGGKYTGTQTVALTANEPATIYYTTNGTDPTTSSTVYTAPISIAATTTLKFYAVDTAGNSEAIIAIKTEVYTIGTQATTGIWETSNWDGALWGP